MKYLNLDATFQPFAQATPETLISFEAFTFSGGEPHIKMEPIPMADVTVMISHRVQSFNDLGLLLVAVDVLRRMNVRRIRLFLPYFPGARQDRVMVAGEPLTVKVYADIINGLELEQITILDAHSDVAPALLEHGHAMSNLDFAQAVLKDVPDALLIAPDAGAVKKVHFLANKLHRSVVTCSKIRDVSTGHLSRFQVYADDLQGQDCLIIDDICDGGRTFLGLAKALKEKNAGRLYLAVTHGIFSKGTEALLAHFEILFTTDSFRRQSDNSFTIKKIQL